MDVWYLPITILPSIGFFIMSTSNVSNSLSGEIARLIEMDKEENKPIILRKIGQLRLLSLSLTLLYLSAACMAISGLIAGLEAHFMLLGVECSKGLIILGIVGIIIALAVLIVYAIRAVNIKRDQFYRNFQ